MTHSAISLGVGLGGGKAATSSGRLPSGGGGFNIDVRDTHSNILARTGDPVGAIAFGTDTYDLYVYDGALWVWYENDSTTAITNTLAGSFDGSDDSLSFGTSTLFNTGSAFSFSAWIKISSYSNTYQSIAQFKTNHSNGFQLLASNGATYTGLNIGSNDETNMMKVKTAGDISGTFLSWTHIAMTYNGSGGSTSSNYKVYVNGSEVSLTSTDGYASLTNVNSIGGGNGGSAFYFDGLMDEVATFDSLLSSSDVTAIYNSGTPADLTSLSPVTWYRLGDGTGDTDSGGGAPASGDTIGTVVDQGSGGNNATGVNGPTYSNSVPVAPFSTLSGSFDGSDDYLDCGTVSTLSSASTFSVSAWYKKASAGGGGLIIGSGTLTTPAERFYIEHFSNNTIYVGYDTTFASFSATADTDWHHVAYVRSSGTHKLYYDGADTSLGGTPASTTSSPLGNNFFIGALTGYAAKFQGIIDEVSVFSSALSASDVTSIYNSGVPANLSSLSPVTWYRLGDGTGDTDSAGGTPANGDTIGTVVDQGSGGNDATGTNGPLYSSTVPS